ncbi:MAG: SH3 domain-containing protein [Anaerolineales bacterium]
MNRASAPEYDRFKSIVAVILVVILLLMLLRGCATNVIPQAPAEAIESPQATAVQPTSPPPSQTSSAAEPTETVAPSHSPTAEATSTPTTVAATETATPVATGATATLVTEATTTAAPDAACNTIVPSRLSVGQTARVLQRLNMRTEASINASIIQTNSTGTQVEIIGGPICTPVGNRAYQWWQIRLPDGTEGWSAETQLNSPSYFLEPAP